MAMWSYPSGGSSTIDHPAKKHRRRRRASPVLAATVIAMMPGLITSLPTLELDISANVPQISMAIHIYPMAAKVMSRYRVQSTLLLMHSLQSLPI